MRVMNRFMLPTISIILGIAMIFPVYMLFISSLRSETHIFDIQLWPTSFELSNFEEAVTHRIFLDRL